MPEWGTLALAWPNGCANPPLATFDVPTGFPDTATIPLSELVTPSRYGYISLPAAPQPQARNLAEPRARWRGAGLFRLDVLVDGAWAASVQPPYAAQATAVLYPGGGVTIDWSAEHAVSLRAWFEQVPPWQEWNYTEYAVIPLGGDVDCWYDPHVLHRHNVYPDEYPAGWTDAYGAPIDGGDVLGPFGTAARCIPKYAGDEYPTQAGTRNVHHFAERQAFDSPAQTFSCVAAPADGTGGDTGGVPLPPPPPAPPQPPPPPPPPPPTSTQTQAFASSPAPLPTDAARSFEGTTADPGRTSPDVLPPQQRIEPAYRHFWQTVIVKNKSSAHRVQRLLAGARASMGRRRR